VQATSNPSISASPSGGFFTPRNINRILLALAFLGIFDASLLSAEVLYKLNLSCGTEGGCATVASHPSAYWFGVPVAYFGFFAYIGFAGLASIRALFGSSTPKFLTYAGLAAAIFGAITSIYLQYEALIVIGAFCPYCFGSAVNMIVTMILYAMLTSRVSALPGAASAPLTDEYPRAAEPARSHDASWVAVGVLGTVVAVVFGATYLQSKHKPPTILSSELQLSRLRPLTDDVHGYGDPNAPLQITEFADLACIHCQMLTPKLHQFIDAHPGKVYAVWRHFPLHTVHQMAVTAALVSEYAARKGKFWDYADKVFATGTEPKTWDEVIAPAEAIGLNGADIKAMIDKGDGPEYTALEKDMSDAGYFGIHETPTFFLVMPGQKARIATSTDVFDVLSAPPFKDYLNKK